MCSIVQWTFIHILCICFRYVRQWTFSTVAFWKICWHFKAKSSISRPCCPLFFNANILPWQCLLTTWTLYVTLYYWSFTGWTCIEFFSILFTYCFLLNVVHFTNNNGPPVGGNPPEREFTPRWGEFPSDLVWTVQKSAHRGRIFDREGWKPSPTGFECKR